MFTLSHALMSWRRTHRRGLSLTMAGAFLLLVTAAPVMIGCSSDNQTATTNPNSDYPVDDRERKRQYKESKGSGSIFGKDGLILFGKKKEEVGGSGVAVNTYLWRASLDTLSFMPLSAADPFGGVIITDWYTPPETPDRRFKANAYILDRDLRADGVRVTLFQQRREANGGWIDASVDDKTASDLEDAILTRARQLRVEQASR